MNVEKLIEEIRKYPVLYDQSDERYKNAEYKERVWKLIATTLEIEDGVDKCKKKWASIRDQLRRTLQKRKTKSGQAAAKARKYKYEDILTFLLPYLGEREGLTNVPQVHDEEQDNCELDADLQDISTQETCQEENVSNVDEQHIEVENLTGTNKDTNMRSRESSLPSISRVSAKKYKFAAPSATKRKIPGLEVRPEDSPASQLMAYILAEKEAEKKRSPCSQTCKQDPVDAFLCGIVPTLKTLDPVLLNEGKDKIFGIVQELELRQLQLNASRQETYSMSSYSTLPSPSAQSPSPSTPSHITTADEITHLNERSYYQF